MQWYPFCTPKQKSGNIWLSRPTSVIIVWEIICLAVIIPIPQSRFTPAYPIHFIHPSTKLIVAWFICPRRHNHYIHCSAILTMFCKGDQSVPASFSQVIVASAIRSHTLASKGDLLAKELRLIDVSAREGDLDANFIVALPQSSRLKLHGQSVSSETLLGASSSITNITTGIDLSASLTISQEQQQIKIIAAAVAAAALSFSLERELWHSDLFWLLQRIWS